VIRVYRVNNILLILYTNINKVLTYLLNSTELVYIRFRGLPAKYVMNSIVDFVINKFFMKLFNTDIDKVVL